MAAVDLSAEGLLAKAREVTGLDDFGDPSFEMGLDVLVETYEGAELNAVGRKMTRSRLVGLLINRLRIQAAFTAHPEIREREITSPVNCPSTGRRFARAMNSTCADLIGRL